MKSKNEQEWRQQLGDDVFRVTRQCGTEPPFSGRYYAFKGDGDYHCICCDHLLFKSTHKYDSGSGWPSFWRDADADSIKRLVDTSHGMHRVEIRCAQCDAHLGHVFPDGPAPSGERFCVNSLALAFIENPQSRDKQ